MPKGIGCFVWDDKTGVEIIEKYPDELTQGLGNDDILTIFTTHALSGEAGILTMVLKQMSVISYYTGKPKEEDEAQFILALFLAENEETGIYEEYLSAIAEMVIKSIGKEDFKDLFIDCYEAASHTKEISEDQYRSFLLRDEISSFIIEMLREGPLTKNELAKYLSKELRRRVKDVNMYLMSLLKQNILYEYSVSEGQRVTSEYLMMIKDLDIIRAPPLNILIRLNTEQGYPELKEGFQVSLEEFFKRYKPYPEDKKKLIEFISNPGTYEIIKILRQGYIISGELTLKMGFSMRNVYGNLKKLTDANIVIPIKDNHEQIWLFLLCDILAMEIYPEYLVDVIYKNWSSGLIDDEVAIEHLDHLRIEYGKRYTSE